MKKSKQIVIFLLYTLIIGLVILLRSQILAVGGIAIVGGLLLVVLLRTEIGEKDMTVETVTDSELEQDGLKELTISKEPIVSKERFIECMKSYNLTKRELELGFLIASGFSNAKIAEELYISESTVKKHASHIYEKVGVSGRKEFKALSLS